MDDTNIDKDESGIAVRATNTPLTHAHSYALRQAIVEQFGDSQKAEHDSINTLRILSRDNTKKVLDVMTRWLCYDCLTANQEDIDMANRISELSHESWRTLVEREYEVNVTLKSTRDELTKAKALSDNLGGPFGAKGLFAKNEEKEKINNAKSQYEVLMKKVDSLDEAAKEVRREIVGYVDVFLRNCCKNLNVTIAGSPLGTKLHGIILEAGDKISHELLRHNKDQQERIEAIERAVAHLKAMYSLEASQ